MHRLLIVADRPETDAELDGFLSAFGFVVNRASSLSLQAIERMDPDLLLLSQELSPANCNQLLRWLRRDSQLPVIVISAMRDVTHRVVTLEMGADDYLVRPFERRELVARIKSVLRRANGHHRTNGATVPETLSIGDIEMHVASRRVFREGKDVELTSLEFDLLRLLLSSAGEAVSRDEISLRILGREPSTDDRSIDVHISGLRKKLGHKSAGMDRIRTVRGFGYVYTLPLNQPLPS